MKRLIVLFLTALFMSSCTTTHRIPRRFVGTFLGQTSGWVSLGLAGDLTLNLDPSGDFHIHWLRMDYTGKWELVSGKRILLRFDELDNPVDYIAAGVITQRKVLLRIINQHEISFDELYVTLERQK